MTAYTKASPQDQHTAAVASQDDFSRALRGQKPLTDSEFAQFIASTKISQQVVDDFMMIVVNHPDLQLKPEGSSVTNAQRIHVAYDGLWDGVALPNLLKIYNLVWDRQMAVWNHETNKPGEKLLGLPGEVCSTSHARFNSHTAGGVYILDTLASTGDVTKADGAAKGEANYRPKPTETGYDGPWFDHV